MEWCNCKVAKFKLTHQWVSKMQSCKIFLVSRNCKVHHSWCTNYVVDILDSVMGSYRVFFVYVLGSSPSLPVICYLNSSCRPFTQYYVMVLSSLSYFIGWRTVETCKFIMGLFLMWASYRSVENKTEDKGKKETCFLDSSLNLDYHATLSILLDSPKRSNVSGYGKEKVT